MDSLRPKTSSHNGDCHLESHAHAWHFADAIINHLQKHTGIFSSCHSENTEAQTGKWPVVPCEGADL